ncbi:MAG TPA: lysylphosphatidylglycerol synthase transmembrane domain-containing protein [Thermoanaerobaculia bacterium]|nr:lysylphosphatidylglycerol synthase transmembrane domain-containing protein [Thermoanaerobaculia bacterium]
MSETNDADDQQPAFERPVILRARVWIPLIIFVGLAIHFLLPRFASVQSLLELVKRLRFLPLLLALIAESLSYVANGWLLWTTITFSKERVSLVRCIEIVTAASTVSLVAAGLIGYAASIYEWTRRSGTRRETATIAAAVPSAFDGAALILFGVISAVILLLRGKMNAWALRSVVIVMLMLVVAATATLLALFAPQRARNLVSRILGRKRHKIAEQIDETLTVVRETIRNGGAVRAFSAACLNLVFDLIAFELVFLATGHGVAPIVLLGGYGVPLLLGRSSFIPGGIAVVEVGMTATYVSLGVPTDVAVVGVLAYRLISFWLPALAGIPIAGYLQTRRGYP